MKALKKFPLRWRTILLLLVVILFLFPLLWLFIAATWPDRQPLSFIWRAPETYRFSVQNFKTAVTLVPMGRMALNSLVVVLLAVPLSVLVASLAGFALARLPAPQQTLLVTLSIVALIMPPTALWLARFPIFKGLGWIDTPLPLIAPALIGGTPFFVLIFFWSFRRLPLEIFEAAVLDGAGPWQVWRHLAFPLSINTTVAIAILSFALFWGNFTDPLLYLRSQGNMTLPVGLQMLAQLDITRWPVLMAGAVLLVLPVLLVFWLGQRYFWRAWEDPGSF